MTTTLEPLVSLRRHASGAPWTVAELAGLVDRLLASAGVEGEKTVTERTVRFYVSREVLEPPFGRGPGSAWGYPHLVELLAARLAQRSGATLEQVADRRRSLSPTELERWVVDDLGVALAAPHDPLQPEPRVAPPARQIVIEPGVELHLAGDHPLAADERRLGVIVARLAREVAPRTQES
jgi:hypothetical protein